MKSPYQCLIICCFLIVAGFVHGQSEKNKGVEVYLVELAKDKESFPLVQYQIAADKQYLIKIIQLPDTPLIAFDDIKYVDWKTHELVLTKDGYKKCKEQFKGGKLESVTGKGIPFVVAINRKPIFIGFIKSYLSSFPPDTPQVLYEGILEDNFIIWCPEKYRNLIENKEMYDYLLKLGKVKEQHFGKDTGK